MCQILTEDTLECLLFECDIENIIIIIFRLNLKAVYFYLSAAAIATCCQLPCNKLKLGNGT